MASGDNIRRRGKLTRELAEGLEELLSQTPVLQVSDIHVSFFAGSGSRIVCMSLLAALQAVTYDIGSLDHYDWTDAHTLLVGAHMGHQIRVLRT